MARLLDVIRQGSRALVPINNLEAYAAALSDFGYAGLGYSTGVVPSGVQTTMEGAKAEPIGDNFVGLIHGAYKSNGVVFAIMLARMLAFSSARFAYQNINKGRPSELFGAASLSLLEEPWIGGTTQELLKRTIQHADLGGNSYWATRGGQMFQLRPDWVTIMAGERKVPGLRTDEAGRAVPGTLWWDKVGYVYKDGGWESDSEPVFLFPDEVSHYAPIPDPEARFRGMSWLTPAIRQIQGDSLMEHHKIKFFENAATPNMVVKHDAAATPEKVTRFARQMDEEYGGLWNAYKTLHLYPGADAHVVGQNMEQLQFSVVQGHGETRLCADGRVPPIIVGLSEGLDAATYSNYAQARRAFADTLLHPLWGDVAGSFQPLLANDIKTLGPPGTVRLWYDARDVPLLRDDTKEAAEIQEIQARTIRSLVDGGYTADSAKRAVLSGDFQLLEHTGLFSVQLRPAGQETPPAPALQGGTQ